MTTNYHELAAEAVKATPPATVSTLVFFGVALSDWVLFCSLGLMACQAFFLFRDKWWRQRGRKK